MAENRKLKLLNQRYNVLNEVYVITKGVDLSDELLAAENYINMVEKREPLVVQFEEIGKALDALAVDGNSASPEEDELLEKTDELMRQLVSEDQKTREKAKDIMSLISDDLTKIKKAKTARKHYEYDIYLSDTTGKGFDKKN